MPGNRETTVQLRPTVTQLCIDQIRPEISINQKCDDSSMRSDLKIMRCSNGPGGSIKPKFVADNRTQRNEHKRRVSLLFSDPFFKFSGKMKKWKILKMERFQCLLFEILNAVLLFQDISTKTSLLSQDH